MILAPPEKVRVVADFALTSWQIAKRHVDSDRIIATANFGAMDELDRNVVDDLNLGLRIKRDIGGPSMPADNGDVDAVAIEHRLERLCAFVIERVGQDFAPCGISVQETTAALPQELGREMEDSPSPIWIISDLSVQHLAINFRNSSADGIGPLVKPIIVSRHDLETPRPAFFDGEQPMLNDRRNILNRGKMQDATNAARLNEAFDADPLLSFSHANPLREVEVKLVR